MVPWQCPSSLAESQPTGLAQGSGRAKRGLLGSVRVMRSYETLQKNEQSDHPCSQPSNYVKKLVLHDREPAELLRGGNK